MGERGGCLPVMSSSCQPPKLLIRKSAIYRLLKRDRTLKDQQLGRVRGKLATALHLCNQNQGPAKGCIVAEVLEKISYSRQCETTEPLTTVRWGEIVVAPSNRDAETQDRTGDLQIFSLTLSQLSYRGPVVDKRTGGYNAALVATTRRTSTPTTSGK